MIRNAMWCLVFAWCFATIGCTRGKEETPIKVAPSSTDIEAGAAEQPGEKPAETAAPAEQKAESFDDVMATLAQTAEATAIVEGPEHKNKGPVYVLAEDDDVVIMGVLNDLAPGVHAIHIHEVGECSGADFATAGGHFNPGNAPHGAPFDESKHVGDLGNLVTNEQGTTVFGIRLTGVKLDESPESILGKAIVVHESADDFKTQPAGGAGARVACGVIQPPSP